MQSHQHTSCCFTLLGDRLMLEMMVSENVAVVLEESDMRSDVIAEISIAEQ